MEGTAIKMESKMPSLVPTFVQTIVRWDFLDPETHRYQNPANDHQVGATSATVEIVTDRSGSTCTIKTLFLPYDKNGAFRKVAVAGQIAKDLRPRWADEMVELTRRRHAAAIAELEPVG